ncbi:MAG TPA: efflux RND transporter periplasmic adaptor subunit [Thermoanaerobaculia bacterium]
MVPSRPALAAIAVLLPLLAGCSKAPAAAATERPPVAVDVARATPGDLQESIAVVGTLAPKFEGEVRADFSGTIAEVLVSEWVPVRKGQVLARFDTREAESFAQAATAARLQAEVGATRALRELQRTEELLAGGLATKQNLDDRRAEAEAAQAALAAARAQERMAGTRLGNGIIRATTDGVVSLRNVNPGDYVDRALAFRIIDNRRLELTVSVPSSAIARVKLGQPLRFTTDGVPGRTFEGRVGRINPAADEASRTVGVIVTIDNGDGALKAGMFAKGEIVTGDRRGVLLVPRTAMVTWDPIKREGALFAVEDGRARMKTIATGAASADAVEVVSGVGAGETVVTRGAFDLKEGDRVTVAAASKA